MYCRKQLFLAWVMFILCQIVPLPVKSEEADSLKRHRLSHQLEFNLREGYLLNTHPFFGGENKFNEPMRSAGSVHTNMHSALILVPGGEANTRMFIRELDWLAIPSGTGRKSVCPGVPMSFRERLLPGLLLRLRWITNGTSASRGAGKIRSAIESAQYGGRLEDECLYQPGLVAKLADQ